MHPSERLRSRASEPQGQHPQPKDEATHRIHSLFRLRMRYLVFRLQEPTPWRLFLGLLSLFTACDPAQLSGPGGPRITLADTAPPLDPGSQDAGSPDRGADPPVDAAEADARARPRDAAPSDPDAGPIDAGLRPPPPDQGPPDHCAGGPLDAPLPGCRPRPLASTGDRAQDCVNRINQFRAECQCLPPLRRWSDGEACADEHAEYDGTRGQPHAGFSGRICAESGFGQNECPGYGGVDHVIEVCLQQMWDEGPGENFQQHGHYLNMTNPRFSMVACGFFDSPQTGMWAVQNFQ
jgi:hypothetical protein